MIEPLALPVADAWQDWLSGRRVGGLLDVARGLLDTLKDGTSRTTDDVLTLWNDADIALRGAGSRMDGSAHRGISGRCTSHHRRWFVNSRPVHD